MAKKHISPRDLKNLSAYLDGELNAYSARKMKNRLARDPNLRAELEAFRETKSTLQRLPKRRAPRNFNVSPQMVAKSPPMPRLVPALNYATALAIILFFFSILPPFNLGSGAMAPLAPNMVLQSATLVAGESAVAEEYAVEEEAMPMASAPEVEEAEEGIAEESAEDAVEESSAEEDSEEARSVESTPIAEPVENAENIVEEVSPSNETETEKTATDNQTVENLPTTTLPSNIEESAEATSAPSLTLWQEVLLVATIFFAITGFILRRRATIKWEKLS